MTNQNEFFKKKNKGAVQSAEYERKLREAYQKYAPKNQPFEDFQKMFANEAEFDEQIAAWSSFEPGIVNMGNMFVKKHYAPAPYSTYDAQLAKQLKDIDAEYAEDIAKLESEKQALSRKRNDYEWEREKPFAEEKYQIKKLAEERLGRRPNFADWGKPELQDLNEKMAEIDARLAAVPLSEEEQDINSQYEKVKNLLEGYEVARDYAKGKLINASISPEVAQRVAETRRQELIDIIANDDELFNQAQKFADLSVLEKQAFLQSVHDKLDEVTHISGAPKVRVSEKPKEGMVANAGRQYNATPLGNKLGIDYILETIVHEQSHAVDHDASDLGMLGRQKAKENYSTPLSFYSTQYEDKWNWDTMSAEEQRYKPIETRQIYMSNPTEFSSWQVGGANQEHMMDRIIEQREKKQVAVSKKEKFQAAAERTTALAEEKRVKQENNVSKVEQFQSEKQRARNIVERAKLKLGIMFKNRGNQNE